MANTTSRTAALGATALCLGFTHGAAWADESHVRDRWVDDPYQDHDTTGAEVRVGSLVGVLELEDAVYSGLGGLVAAGHRWGALAVDAEYGYLEISARGPSSVRYGALHQLGVNVRYDVLRFGSRWIGPNSMASLWVEAHAGRRFVSGDPVAPNETVRARLSTSQATQLGAGFGLMFDHRIEQPRGFPNRVGWQLGWRVLAAPTAEPAGYVACRGQVDDDCTAAPAPERPPMFTELGETSLVLGSSLAFTW